LTFNAILNTTISVSGRNCCSNLRGFQTHHAIPSFMSTNNRKGCVIGITGGIACGKSEVGRILEEMNFTVLDADLVAHSLMSEGSPVYKGIVEHFGTEILSDSGEILRPILAKTVFGNAEKRALLNRLVHPEVRDQLDRWIKDQRSADRRAAVLLPLLFESGMQNLDWNGIVCVSADRTHVLARLKERGLNMEEAKQRINSQMPLAEKERLADHVLPNNGTRRELELAVRETVNAFMGER